MDPLSASDPRTLGDITLRGRLGAGGMGQVYAGETPDGDRVAVKTLHSATADRDDLRERFDREVAAMRMVQGPGTAALLAASPPDADPQWLAMEYVPGLTLRDYVHRNGPMSSNEGKALGLVLARALADIHGAALLHRDLKPSNVILGPDGPCVIDFGLVAIGGAVGELTATNAMLGTPLCMAPEQAQNAKAVGTAADMYALGATLTFAVTGHYPIERPTPEALFAALVTGTEPDLTRLPEELRPIVAALLSRDPDDRPQLADVRAQLTEMLAEIGQSPGAARIRLAHTTYVAGPDDGDSPVAVDPAAPIPVPRPRHHLARSSASAPTPLVQALASRLRNEYDRSATLAAR
ncbi:hypothetical protein GCM10009799_28080 [Nocardiopsis rhodophaea]|uniref:Protein kinase domain-containing protein n=1 Tax=Nocardiopsis rhodophaea TaxID=280238 RepID=A0ABN2T5H1_9ACTN